MYTWTDKILKKNEYYRLYYSLYHSKNTVGGVSGFIPNKTAKLLSDSRKAGSIDQIIGTLKYCEPDILIIHKDQQTKPLGKSIKIDTNSESVIWKDGNTTVIELR